LKPLVAPPTKKKKKKEEEEEKKKCTQAGPMPLCLYVADV